MLPDEHSFGAKITLGWIGCYPTLALSETVWSSQGERAVSAEVDDKYAVCGHCCLSSANKWNNESTIAVYPSAEVVPRRAWVPPRRERGNANGGKPKKGGSFILKFLTQNFFGKGRAIYFRVPDEKPL